MWILPKQLHTSAFVPDTAALRLDCTELSEICARSLFVRSKPSPARTWSQKWKRDSWTQHLYGRILNPSHGQSFVTAWTSSLAVIPASHSAQPERDSAQKTLGTSGLSSQTEFDFFAPDSAISRMSKDTSASDSEKSLESWNQSVTRRRGEYSRRLKSAHRTSASGCLSWPTIRASEYKDTGPIGSKSHDHMLGKGYLCAVVTQDAANWPTPDTSNHRDGDVLRKDNNLEQGGFHGVSLHHAMTKYGQAAPANPSTDGSRQGLWQTPDVGSTAGGRSARGQSAPHKASLEKQCQWATPRSGKTTDENPETWALRQAKGDVATMPLTAQVKCWGTPTTRDHKSGRGNEEREYKELTPMVERTQVGKLNPRWVETLQGVCMGWTSPSCPASVIKNWPKFVSGWCAVTIEPTSFDSSATESSLQQPRELFAF